MKALEGFIILIFSTFCCLNGTAVAQNSTKGMTKSIYEVGKSITDCDANFKNLFNNWKPEKVTNAKDFHLIRYSYVETISDSSVINQYCKLFADNDAMISCVNHYSTDIRETKGQSLYFTIKPFASVCDTMMKRNDEKVRMQNGFEAERVRLKDSVKRMVHMGDKVYAIYFRDRNRTYVDFVICSARTNKVVWDNLFNNISLWVKLS